MGTGWPCTRQVARETITQLRGDFHWPASVFSRAFKDLIIPLTVIHFQGFKRCCVWQQYYLSPSDIKKKNRCNFHPWLHVFYAFFFSLVSRFDFECLTEFSTLTHTAPSLTKSPVHPSCPHAVRIPASCPDVLSIHAAAVRQMQKAGLPLTVTSASCMHSLLNCLHISKPAEEMWALLNQAVAETYAWCCKAPQS